METIKLDYTFNTRDLSNYKTSEGRTIKSKRLIRSGALHKLSDKDVNTLKENNLKIVIDFRSEKEFVNKADRRIDGVNYLNFPVLGKDNLPKKKESDHSDSNLLQLVDKEYGGAVLLKKTYKDFVECEQGIIAYKNFFKVVQENKEGAILWHCSQGKDRAGFAAFLVLYSLGVSLQDCYEDYLYSNIAMELKIKQLTPLVLKMSNNDESLLPILKDVFLAKMEYLNETLKTIKSRYNSLDNFLIHILGVNIEKMKENYLNQ